MNANVALTFRLNWTLVITAAIALAGCQTPSPHQAATQAPATSPPPAEAETLEESSGGLGQLAEQAQRDVDELMRLRAGNTEPDAAPRAQPPAPTPTPATTIAAAPPIEQPPLAMEESSLRPGNADEPSPPDPHEIVAQVRQQLAALAAWSEDPMREALVLSALRLLDEDSSLPSELSDDLTESEQQILQSLGKFFQTLAKELRTNSAGAEEAVAGAAESLRTAVTRPMLRLQEAHLCWEVLGFSRFEPFSHHAFLAGTEQDLIVYVQVSDFATIEDGQGTWATKLSQELVIYNGADGAAVWREDWQPAVDRTRGTRRDFFLTQVLTLPRALSVGKYQLKIRVRDDQSKAQAETTIPFEMVADPRLAAKAGK